MDPDEQENQKTSERLLTIASETMPIIEFVGGVFGFLGIGWLLANRHRTGLILLISYFLVRVLTLSYFSDIIELLLIANFFPIIISSLYLLHKNHKKQFKSIQIPNILVIVFEAMGGIIGIVGIGWIFANKSKQGIAIMICYYILKCIYKVYTHNSTNVIYAIINVALISTSILVLYRNNLSKNTN